MKEYTVIYEQGPTSWGAYSPDVPGCVAVGDTREEVERLFREALELHIGSMIRHGSPIPKSSTDAGKIAVPIVIAA